MDLFLSSPVRFALFFLVGGGRERINRWAVGACVSRYVRQERERCLVRPGVDKGRN